MNNIESTNIANAKSPGKELFKLFVPILFGFIINNLYNVVDTLWLGNLVGKEAIAAVAVSYPVIIMVSAVAMGASNAVTILVSNFCGAEDDRSANETISTALIFIMGFCFVIVLLLELFSYQILTFLHTPLEIMPSAVSYFRVYVLGIFSVYIYYHFAAVLRAYGNSTIQMLFLVIATIINMILDPLFINGFLFIPRLGVVGAAWATVLSQSVIAVALIVVVWRKKLFIIFRKDSINIKLFVELLKLSMLSIVQQIVPSLSLLVVTYLVNSFGIVITAAYGIASKIDAIIILPAMAMNIALTTVCGHCYGANNMKKSEKYIKIGTISALAITISITIFILLFINPIARAFINDAVVIVVVKQYFYIISVGYLLNVVTCTALGALNGYKKTFINMIIFIVGYLAVRVPVAFIFSKTSLLENGIWFAFTLSYLVTAFISVIYYIYVAKGIKNLS